MANLEITRLQDNEMARTDDLMAQFEGTLGNLKKFAESVISIGKNYIIGGEITKYSGQNNKIVLQPCMGYHNPTGQMFLETEANITVDIPDYTSSLNRIDVLEIKGNLVDSGTLERRGFINFSDSTITYSDIKIKKALESDIKVKKGLEGSSTAPLVDDGYVKIAELKFVNGTLTIYPVTATADSEENIGWTNDKQDTCKVYKLREMLIKFRTIHNADGTLKDNVVPVNAIVKSGETGINAQSIPLGESMFDLPLSTNIYNAMFDLFKRGYTDIIASNADLIALHTKATSSSTPDNSIRALIIGSVSLISQVNPFESARQPFALEKFALLEGLPNSVLHIEGRFPVYSILTQSYINSYAFYYNGDAQWIGIIRNLNITWKPYLFGGDTESVLFFANIIGDSVDDYYDSCFENVKVQQLSASANDLVSYIGFKNCTKLEKCSFYSSITGSSFVDKIYGFKSCEFVDKCFTDIKAGLGADKGHSFSDCNAVTNCIARASFHDYAIHFNNCKADCAGNTPVSAQISGGNNSHFSK